MHACFHGLYTQSDSLYLYINVVHFTSNSSTEWKYVNCTVYRQRLLGRHLPCKAFQAIALALSGGVPEAGQVHGVGRKAPAVYAVIAQHMSVKAVVVPHLLDAVVLKELLENRKYLFIRFLQRQSIFSMHNIYRPETCGADLPAKACQHICTKGWKTDNKHKILGAI